MRVDNPTAKHRRPEPHRTFGVRRVAARAGTELSIRFWDRTVYSATLTIFGVR